MVDELVTCIAEDCDRRATCRTKTNSPMCSKHHERFKRLGSYKDEYLVRWGRHPWRVGTDGYLVKSVGGRKITQHREIMENLIGRKLTSKESVHHKNGVKTDNRPENLELWASTQPSGQRVVDLVAWAKVILVKYEDTVDKLET